MDDDTSTASILIRSGDLGARLSPLVEALDAQILPYNRYDVTFLDPGSSDSTSERLAELADRRPNVRVIADQDGNGPDWRSAVDTARGEYVLFLSPDDQLLPDGLAALLDAAAEGHDVVLAGGSGRPVGFEPDAIGRGVDAEPLDRSSAAAPVAMLAPFTLIRRTALLDLPDDLLAGPEVPFRTTRVALLAAVGSVAACDRPVGNGTGPVDGETAASIWADARRAVESVESLAPEAAARFVAAHAAQTLQRLGDPKLPDDVSASMTELVRRFWQDRDPQTLPYVERGVVSALVTGEPAAAQAAAREAAQAAAQLELVADSTSAAWDDGVLAVTVRGRVRGIPAELLSDLDLRLSIRRLPNRSEYDLVADTTLEADAEGPAAFVAHSTVDIAKAAAGSALVPGNWEVRARLLGTGSASAIIAVAPAFKLPGAVVDGTPISVFQRDNRLRLDIGAHDHGTLPVRFAAEQAQISETARGALLTLSMPDLAVRGREPVPSTLFLGGFPLPATLRPTDKGAQLECYVSGVAGVSRLETRIGAGKRQPTGLQLKIGGAGEMAVEIAPPTRPAKPAVKSAPKPAPKPATGPGSATPGGKPTRAPAPGPRGGRIIRKVPAPLRPLAKVAADTPAIKAAYRRITGRG